MAAFMQYDTTTMSLNIKPGLSPASIALIESGDYPVKIKLTNSLGISQDFIVTFTAKVAKIQVKIEIKPTTTPTSPAKEKLVVVEEPEMP